MFETARKRAPAIIFIDEIDAIAQKRDALSGEKQVERRIVAQLLTLMDGLAGRGEVIVLAATNLPDGIDPALRRPGRFDREIRVDPPDREGRREILAVHTRGMPLGADVDLSALAADTHGHVGADLAALCREAAMAALAPLRRPVVRPARPTSPALRVEDRDFQAALREVTPSALREVFVEVPDVRWQDVAGMDALRETLIRAVQQPLADPDRFTRMGVRPPRGVLLHGRPGTGKTLIARALATEAQAGFISIRGPELLAEWQGASERALREVFARARMAAPCIVFFDEIDAVAGRRGSGGGATVERMVAQLLTEMDGITQPGGLVVLAATNRPDLIDPALLRPGRFDLVLEMPLPDAAGAGGDAGGARAPDATRRRCRPAGTGAGHGRLRRRRHRRAVPAGGPRRAGQRPGCRGTARHRRGLRRGAAGTQGRTHMAEMIMQQTRLLGFAPLAGSGRASCHNAGDTRTGGAHAGRPRGRRAVSARSRDCRSLAAAGTH